MSVVEIRDSAAARRYLLRGLMMQRLGRLDDQSVTETLRWVGELAANDEPIPPPGFVADVGQLVLSEEVLARKQIGSQNYVPAELAQRYEDHVLGKLYADGHFKRGCTAVCRYSPGDRRRGVAWIIARITSRTGAVGIMCSPGVVRSLQRDPLETLMAEALESLAFGGKDDLVLDHYSSLIQGFRDTGSVLGTEDVFELERETALVEFGQRLAMRQTLVAFSQLKSVTSELRPRTSGRDQSVVTNLHEEDAYPVGGFTSISTRGTIESLLHSQLAYMEHEEGHRPDLFDVKYLRSELLYYSRDENEFLRQRRAFVFLLHPSLISARVRDTGLQFQRGVMALAVLYLCVIRLTEWLAEDSLIFEFVVIAEGGGSPLQDETEVLEMLLRDQIASGSASVQSETLEQVSQRVQQDSNRQVTHCISVSATECPLSIENVIQTYLLAGEAGLELQWDADILEFAGDADGWQGLANALLSVLV